MQPNILMADPQKPPTKIIYTFLFKKFNFIQNSRLHALLLQVTYTFNPTLRDNDSANKQFRYLS